MDFPRNSSSCCKPLFAAISGLRTPDTGGRPTQWIIYNFHSCRWQHNYHRSSLMKSIIRLLPASKTGLTHYIVLLVWFKQKNNTNITLVLTSTSRGIPICRIQGCWIPLCHGLPWMWSSLGRDKILEIIICTIFMRSWFENFSKENCNIP